MLRPIVPLFDVVEGVPKIGPPPPTERIRLAQLAVNEEYQRELTPNSRRLIKKMAMEWDWAAFKPPSVIPVGSLYEVIDGQHTAIAAVTNGTIDWLPCLVHAERPLKERAGAFVRLNSDRIALTRAAIFHAQVAAGDANAVGVVNTLKRAQCTLLLTPPATQGDYKPGETMALGTLCAIQKRYGSEYLYRILQCARLGNAVPISANLIKALDHVLHPTDPSGDATASRALRTLPLAKFEITCRGMVQPGGKTYSVMASMIRKAITTLPAIAA
ncbi:MAG: DUF6551 family protein [Hyphomonadaceae bacterium]